MKRLTFEGNFCDIAMCGEVRGGSFCEDGDCSQRKTWERLKAIEDILCDSVGDNDPDAEDEYDVDRLSVLVEMDSAGCIPPCKIGDVFYRVCYGFDSPEIEKYRVSMVTQKADRSWRIRATDTESSFQIDWSLDDFSKRAYKTREEAEAALAKLNSET